MRGARGQEHRTAVGKRRENDFTVLVVENAGSLSSTICKWLILIGNTPGLVRHK